ncbi:hypothetical protein T12_15899 [Trichinella patagoniensis]|uniref:Uncharacterized protein n=1 Tax=Trichinella patagoniensis TaxID=990121 RepID=A0A0V1AFM9_9BILA|nr:hypothetical protein T12_15899 [Trichinella patagoniensis]
MEINLKLKVLILIAKSPIRKLQSERQIREKRMLCPSDFCREAKVQFDAVRGYKRCVLIGKLTAANVERQTIDLLSFYSLLFFGIISEK